MTSTNAIANGVALAVSPATLLSSSTPFISKLDQFMTSASNATSIFNPSRRDLFMAVPRMITRIASFVLVSTPDRIDSLLGLGKGGSVIAEATGEMRNTTVTAALSGRLSIQSAAAATAASTAARLTVTGRVQGGVVNTAFSFQHLRNFGGIFTYMTSKWALTCFTLAVILNRTSVYATPRRPLVLGFSLRFALRIGPVILFLFHIKNLLEAMRCQTSPRFSSLKYGELHKQSDLDFAGDGGLLYYLSSTLLFWQGDMDSCLLVGMVQDPSTRDPALVKGSLSLLWPLFQSLCFSQFIENLSCAIQGRFIMTETGMSIFEHSLAFAEAEAMISNQLGLSPFGLPKVGGPNSSSDGMAASEVIGLVSKNVFFDSQNTPPEVLLMGLISSLNHLTSQILGMLNMQASFRLINTGIWGMCFMGSFVWGFLTFSPTTAMDAIILRFPTVCIVGFIPHLLVLVGICVCACIYLLAMIISVLSPPNGEPVPTSVLERFSIAHRNLLATAQFSSLRLRMHEDFYSALLKAGFTVLTVASEAVYLNEGRQINVSRWTWLEEERMQELEASLLPSKRAPHDFTAGVVPGVGLAESTRAQALNESKTSTSGYAREKTTKILKSGPNERSSRAAADGVGALERGGRYIMAWEFFAGIFRLLTGVLALGLIKALDWMGIARRPRWLLNPIHQAKPQNVQENSEKATQPRTLEFWLLSEDGVLSLPENDNVDVEAETKKRLQYATDSWGEEEQRTLDSRLYEWWFHGGWWGERDESGTYQASEQDDDTTSVISSATYENEREWETDDDGNGSGNRTPTQEDPYGFTRDSIPITDHALDPVHLAQLLDPKNPAERQEARMLAHHLASDHIVTRSSFRHAQEFERARVLTSTLYRPSAFHPVRRDGILTADEETQLLEHLLVSRRSSHRHANNGNHNAASSTSGTWQNGGEGLGAGGPQCVVCQTSPRTVLAWPCRCLSLCEDCRISLAMNNFGTCVCCRVDVVGYSRLFVP